MLREEIALLDVRHEAEFATGHPLFAANMAAGRIALEAELAAARKDVAIVLYDNGDGLVAAARQKLAGLGYSNVRELAGGLKAWAAAGYESLPTSIPTPKPLASSSSRAVTRRRCRRTMSPR